MRTACAAFASALVFASSAAAAERVPRVALVANTYALSEWPAAATPDGTPHVGRAILEGLERLGWVDGKNMQIVWRSAEGRFERLPGIFDELAKMPVDMIVAFGPAGRLAAKSVTRIPVVVAISSGAVSTIGESLARPGRNVTGLTVEEVGLHSKRLSLLKQALPHVRRVALMQESPGNCGTELPSFRATAKTLGIEMLTVTFEPHDGVEQAFQESAALRPDAILICDGVWVWRYGHQRRINDVAMRHRLPVMHTAAGGADNGGLMAFGTDNMVQYRRMPYFIDRILRGTKPAELPIEQPVAVELVVNRRVARALGLSLPEALLLQANRVID